MSKPPTQTEAFATEQPECVQNMVTFYTRVRGRHPYQNAHGGLVGRYRIPVGWMLSDRRSLSDDQRVAVRCSLGSNA
jgi:hypothetical protein